MQKTILLKKMLTFPKLKLKNTKKVYDKEWNMLFRNAKERKNFINAINKSEKDEKEGRTGTWEELLEEFEKEYGIQLQH